MDNNSKWRFDEVQARVSVNVGTAADPEWHAFFVTQDELDSNIKKFGPHPELLAAQQALSKSFGRCPDCGSPKRDMATSKKRQEADLNVSTCVPSAVDDTKEKLSSKCARSISINLP